MPRAREKLEKSCGPCEVGRLSDEFLAEKELRTYGRCGVGFPGKFVAEMELQSQWFGFSDKFVAKLNPNREIHVLSFRLKYFLGF